MTSDEKALRLGAAGVLVAGTVVSAMMLVGFLWAQSVHHYEDPAIPLRSAFALATSGVVIATPMGGWIALLLRRSRLALWLGIAPILALLAMCVAASP